MSSPLVVCNADLWEATVLQLLALLLQMHGVYHPAPCPCVAIWLAAMSRYWGCARRGGALWCMAPTPAPFHQCNGLLCSAQDG